MRKGALRACAPRPVQPPRWGVADPLTISSAFIASHNSTTSSVRDRLGVMHPDGYVELRDRHEDGARRSRSGWGSSGPSGRSTTRLPGSGPV
ncbi:MAG: hypothetical protein WAL38_37225 [Solirubrobacteraceae bacterium]